MDCIQNSTKTKKEVTLILLIVFHKIKMNKYFYIFFKVGITLIQNFDGDI